MQNHELGIHSRQQSPKYPKIPHNLYLGYLRKKSHWLSAVREITIASCHSFKNYWLTFLTLYMCLENTKTIKSSLLATIHLIIFHPHLSTIYLARSHPWRRRGFQFSTELQIVCKKKVTILCNGFKILSSLLQVCKVQLL